MGIAKDYLDPEAGGVSQATFDAHSHNYRKVMQIGISVDHLYDPVLRYDVVDDAEVVAFIGNNADAEAVGVTVSTLPTSMPV